MKYTKYEPLFPPRPEAAIPPQMLPVKGVVRMKTGKIYLIRDSIKKGNGREERRVDSISVETPDGRFVRIHRTSGIFDGDFQKCRVGSTVEWDGTTHFKIIEVGS